MRVPGLQPDPVDRVYSALFLPSYCYMGPRTPPPLKSFLIRSLRSFLALSSALLLLRSSALLCAVSLIDLDVDRVTKIVVPLLLVVGVAISCRPLTAHCSSEAMSSKLMLGIASCNVGSAIPVGVAHSSSWVAGVVTGAGVCCWDGSDACCCQGCLFCCDRSHFHHNVIKSRQFDVMTFC